jgi:hypothetical protein
VRPLLPEHDEDYQDDDGGGQDDERFHCQILSCARIERAGITADCAPRIWFRPMKADVVRLQRS